jgi:hypothetical protein
MGLFGFWRKSLPGRLMRGVLTVHPRDYIIDFQNDSLKILQFYYGNITIPRANPNEIADFLIQLWLSGKQTSRQKFQKLLKIRKRTVD